ncbi:MAG: DUF6186 family protein [Acidimicrobiales bacterium]
MNGELAWIALLFVVVSLELLARARPGAISTITEFVALLSSRTLGRVLLYLVWVFVGVHFFARYTIPR